MMMRVFLLMMLFAVAVPMGAQAGGKESIVAVVNQGVVTSSDLQARLDLIAMSTGLPPSKELTAKLRPQVLDMLIEETVKTQEADRLKIAVDPKEVEEGFATIAKQNNIPADTFRKALQQRGINTATMNEQIRAQLAWNKVIQKRVRPRVDVSEADIDSELDVLRAAIGKTQYRVAEIFLPISEQAKSSDVANLARKLSDQLQGTPEAFPKVARQFSQSAGAEQGGMIGWVFGGQMPEEIDEALPSLAVGKVSQPIKTASGYYILFVADKRQLTEETLPPREEILQRIGTQRLDRAQRRYLMDLMSSAFIEKRV
ncbi:MAG TPA: SurA N-terminal domain-containing protein [Alphaproteobacteria bacterium]|nr:SurA N-terminal domain-containing protein [Alphaproteobacteria bacterium]HNS43731.1 SurA N-terminal domain-containing protein [Alphaproteobacteria bacterium]